jgi:hypothetical protein
VQGVTTSTKKKEDDPTDTAWRSEVSQAEERGGYPPGRIFGEHASLRSLILNKTELLLHSIK